MTESKSIRRGRPKMENQKEKRIKRLPVIQVSEEELATYKTASKEVGMTFSAWVRLNLDKASRGN